MANRIQLPNGCSMSYPCVNPGNWKTGGIALLKKNWRIQYYFYDPELHVKNPYGKLICVKGMNSFKDLNERRSVTSLLIEDEIANNRKGYHPIKKQYMVASDLRNADLHPHLPFLKAFEIALEKIKCTDVHRKQIYWAIKRMEINTKKLGFLNIPINQLKRSDVKRILESCDLTDNYFNKYRAYLSRLFTELLEYECCETNLVRDIRRKKTTKTNREVLSVYEMKVVMDYLQENYYEFWRYAQIFLYSGSRSAELLSLKRKDVDLINQEYTITIKKGRSYKQEIKVILKEALPLWKEQLKGANPSDYVFSLGLLPGQEKIQPFQITKRWYRLVKNKEIRGAKNEVLKITADFYSLKHSFLDSLPIEVAQKIASHSSSRTTEIYQVTRDKKLREMLKNLDVSMSN